MLGVLIYLVCGWMVMLYRRPIQFAFGASVAVTVLGLLFGTPLLASAIGFVLMTAMFAGFYFAVDYFSDGVIKPIVYTPLLTPRFSRDDCPAISS